MTTAWDRITDDAYKKWLLSAGTTSEEFNSLDFQSRVHAKAAFDALQQQGNSIRSPEPVRLRRSLDPQPSEGKRPPLRPKMLEAPSSEDGQQNALKYGCRDDSQNLFCSAHYIALEVVSLLDNAIKSNVGPEYTKAADYILKVREKLENKELAEEEIRQNERLYTGAFCDGLNSVLSNGISVLHQGCIGKEATHSDLSARYVHDKCNSPTLMVGEAKMNTSHKIRTQTRGQLLNELIRHRRLDSKLRRSNRGDYRPILLLALNLNYISIDLAFPSTKGGYMEQSGWVAFSDAIQPETETFWTIPVAMVSIAMNNGKENLKYVLRFVADTLEYIQKCSSCSTRVQFKSPRKTSDGSEEEVNEAAKYGDNVTIVTFGQQKHVYKEFCYYMRQKDDFNALEIRIEKDDQRWPPDPELLALLGEMNDLYKSWKIHKFPFDISILEYEYIEGSSRPTSKEAWLMVLKQVGELHSKDYVHGDLLPRNLIFSGDSGYVIDFDLTRKQGGSYVAGYNRRDFLSYRHPDARSGKKMLQVHDVWALNEMSQEFFELSDLNISAESTLDDLLTCFGKTDVKLKDATGCPMGFDPKGSMENCNATGSPTRAVEDGDVSDQLKNLDLNSY